MYKCLDCGAEFESPESWQESRGEYWGIPAYETCYGCPICGGDYEEFDEESEEEETDDECD